MSRRRSASEEAAFRPASGPRRTALGPCPFRPARASARPLHPSGRACSRRAARPAPGARHGRAGRASARIGGRCVISQVDQCTGTIGGIGDRFGDRRCLFRIVGDERQRGLAAQEVGRVAAVEVQLLHVFEERGRIQPAQDPQAPQLGRVVSFDDDLLEVRTEYPPGQRGSPLAGSVREASRSSDRADRRAGSRSVRRGRNSDRRSASHRTGIPPAAPAGSTGPIGRLRAGTDRPCRSSPSARCPVGRPGPTRSAALDGRRRGRRESATRGPSTAVSRSIRPGS